MSLHAIQLRTVNLPATSRHSESTKVLDTQLGSAAPRQRSKQAFACTASSEYGHEYVPVFDPWQQLIGCLGLAAFFAYQERPRGWSNKALVQVSQLSRAYVQCFSTTGRPNAVDKFMKAVMQVAESHVAGKGVFAIKPIPKGTIVGGYPGLPRKAKSMVAKASRVPACQQYVFQISNNLWLDPTDSKGEPAPQLLPLLPFLLTDVSMAYMNEPPVGQIVNTEFSDSATADLQFLTVHDVSPGQELFTDYGNMYNRSGYAAR